MKFLKNFFLRVFLVGALLIPVHQARAEIMSVQFVEEVTKNIIISCCTTAIYIGALLYVQYSLQKQQETDIVNVKIEPKKDDNEQDSSKNKDEESHITVYYPGDITTKFQDVAGLAGAKADLQDIISYLKHPHAYTQMGAKVPKGVVMNGAPGNGKTLLARAVAGEASCPLVSISGSSFAEMYIGIGAKRVRALFKAARKLADVHGACIIFIDEIDAVAQKRSTTGNSGDRDFNQTITELLKCMDGIEKDTRPIIVLAATNRIEALDPAILRAGRFDRKVEVCKPEIKDRVQLLHHALKTVKHSSKVDINRLARITNGFSGAELALLVNEAALLAVAQGKEVVDTEHIELAYDHMTLGRQIQGMELNEQDQWITAIHEAGHAAGYLFAAQQRYAIHKASIVPRSKTLGVVWGISMHESHCYTQADMRAKIVVALCGTLAEEAFGFEQSTGPSSDLAKARSIAYDMVVSYGMSDKLKHISYDEVDRYLPDTIATQVHEEVKRIIDECLHVAQQLVSSHKKEIESIAKILMKKGTVLGDEIYQLVKLPMPALVCGL